MKTNSNENKTQKLKEHVKERSRTAFDNSKENTLDTLKLIAFDPIANLSSAYSPLSAPQATGVGIIMGVSSSIIASLGSYFLILGLISGTIIEKIYQPDFNHVIIFFFSFVLLFFSIAVSHFIVRKFFGDANDYDVDIFVAGVSTLPFGVSMLPAGLIALIKTEIGIGLSVCAFCYAIMIIYVSLRDISTVPKHIVAPAVPIITIIGLWLAKTLVYSYLF